MFRSSRHSGGISVLLRRVNIGTLIVIFSLGSAGQTTPVRAAPPGQDTITNMRFYLNVFYPPTLCAGQEYSILVTPLVDLDGKRPDGSRFSYRERIIPGVPITAEITDTSFATVEPAKPRSKTSGSLPDNILATSSLAMQARLGNLGEVVFKLTTKKAGKTNFYLTAEVPRQWSGSTTKYFGPNAMPTGGEIKIVDCKYRVIMDYDWQSSGDVNGWWYGHLDTLIESKTGELYQGTGSFNFFGHIYVPGCGSTWNAFQIPTDITGTKTTASSMEFLELNFDYGTATGNATISCPEIGTISGSGLSDPMSNGGITSARFEPEGQTLVFSTPGIGSPAKLTITLQPVTK